MALGLAVTLLLPRAALGAVGTRDRSFAGSGYTTVDWAGLLDQAWDVAIQPDGKIVVVGSSQRTTENWDLKVLRYLPNGLPDPTFGTSGEFSLDRGNYDLGTTVAIQPDGKILIGANGFLLRLNPDGTLDSGFGQSGVASSSLNFINDLLLVPGGDALVVGAGMVDSTRQTDLMASRYTAYGQLDASFGTNGEFTFDSGSIEGIPTAWIESANAATLMPDGTILLVGQRSQISFLGAPPSDTLLVRLTTGGELDPNFGTLGWRIFDFAEEERGVGIVTTPSGQAVFAASIYPGGQLGGSILARLNLDGSVDSTFGSGGFARDSIQVGHLALDSAGRFLAAGPTGQAAEIKRFTSSGAVDMTFNQGRYLSDIGPSSEVPTAIAEMPDGRLAHVGMTWVTSSAIDLDWYIEVISLEADGGQPLLAGYHMLGAAGEVFAFGSLPYRGRPSNILAANIAESPSGNGYWIVSRDGAVYSFGDASYFGGRPQLLQGEVVSSISATPVGDGYRLFTNYGRVFPYGRAQHFGDLTGYNLNGPVVGSATTPSGNGYYMVASDGGIFAWGDASFRGSMGGHPLNQPVVGIAPDPDGLGYWLVAADGGIFSFDATFRGSMGGTSLNRPVVGAAAYGDGYLLVASDGGIFNFSTHPFAGSLGSNPPANPVIALSAH